MTRTLFGMIVFTTLLCSAATSALCAPRTEQISGASAPAQISGASAAENLKYYPDPVYKRLNNDDPPAMSDMTDLANQGDVRAMFILGDMYEKGKGGLPKDLVQARHWFEESGMHGYGQSFIRLAAIAKHANNTTEAWQWYSLAIKNLDNDDTQQYAIRARKDLTDSAKLSDGDIDQAHKLVSAWEDARDKHLRDEKDAEAEKEKQQKEQEEKQAQDGAANSSVATTATTGQDDKKPEQQEQENDNEQN